MVKPRDWVRREPLIFITLLLMVAGLFGSRAGLSVAVIGFAALTLVHRDLAAQVRRFFKDPLAAGISLLFFIPLISGIWSEDTDAWTDSLRIKLPLLLLPLGFAGPWKLPRRYWEWLCLFWIALTLAGAAWSSYHYFTDPQEMAAGYLRAHTLPTPLQGDHVRFSWMVVIALFGTAGLLYRYQAQQRRVFVLIIVFILLTAYLHLLAVRTGLGAFYGSLLLGAGWVLIRQRSFRLAAGIGAGLLLLPLIAWFLFPTLQNRVRYIRYDQGYFEKGHYWRGGNDALRVISWKAGISLWQSSPWLGTGFGDLKQELDTWYQRQYPDMTQEEHLLPASEWILYAAAAGIAGLLGFTAALLLPLFSRVRSRGPWWILNAAAGFTLLFDIGLEVQYGVFIHAFVLLAGREWLNAQNNTSLQPHDALFHRDRLPQ